MFLAEVSSSSLVGFTICKLKSPLRTRVLNGLRPSDTALLNGEFLFQEKKLLRQARYMKKRHTDLQQKLKKSKINDTTVLNYLSTKLNGMQYAFISMQLTNNGRTKHGRRYNANQKSMS